MVGFLYIIFFWCVLVSFHTNVNAAECTCEPVCPYTSLPGQLRVAIQGANTVTVSWRTNGTIDGGNDTPIPQVEYSVYLNMSSSFIANGTSSTYTKLGTISWFHNCILNINLSTVYYYRIRKSSCVNESTIHSFTTQPPVGDLNPINITIVGDLGYNNWLNQNLPSVTIERLAAIAPKTNFFLHVGDISYADDVGTGIIPAPLNATFESTWNKFQQDMEIVTADNLYMTVPGNHEVTCVQGADISCKDSFNKQYRNFSAYLHRFSMPGDPSDGSYPNLWYSFQYGLAHIVVINTETDFTNSPSGPTTSQAGGDFAPKGAQLKWLKGDLEYANSQRDKVPWIIVAGHRPLYTSKPWPSFGQYTCPSCVEAFSRTIFNNMVDFYFAGHVHWYERLFPVDCNGNAAQKNYTKPAGPIHVTTGSGGPAEGVQQLDPRGPRANASAFINSTVGYTQLAIKNSSYAQLIFYETQSNRIMDAVDIYRT